ncbi:MAG: VWA domain-containing protein [Rhodobiaceae bacterium]|nr:VWA domain-containing protein [Rhodobiaceae bacterium]
MTQMLGNFIRALRASDVRVSISESIDAGRTAELVGFEDREILKSALSQVLAKTDEEEFAFNSVFDRYFSFEKIRSPAANDGAPEDENQDDNASDNTSEEDDSSESDESESQGQGGPPGSGGGAGGQSEKSENASEQEAQASPDLLELLERGDTAALQQALAEAGQNARIDRIRLFTQRGMYVRRIMEDMGLEGLEMEIERATDKDEDRVVYIRGLRDGLREQVRDYVERQLDLYTANAGQQLREEVLSRVRLTNVDRRDMRLMQGLVRKMAKRLVALNSRRRKKDIRGALNFRKTIRRNIAHDGIMFDIHWKQKKIDRPKLVAICDVSGSVSSYAHFLLMFLYSLQEVLPKVRAFAFSGELGEVTDLFKTQDLETAIGETLKIYGSGSTDYGRAFEELERTVLDDIDHRTTVIILGDGRSNNADPRADILKVVHARAKRVLWLNPEPKSMWGTGDSEMKSLAAYCDSAATCTSLKDLERVVSDILRKG